MGRKIPGRKHKGTKDPDKQRRERFNKIKNKINLPPSNPNEQETPRSLDQLARSKEEWKCKKGMTRNKPKQNRKRPFERKQGETSRQFLYRVNKACDAVIQENAFENKYGVNVKRNPQTGKVEGLVKKPKDEIDELRKKLRKQKSIKGKAKKVAKEPALTKPQKRRKKLKEKKQKKELLNNNYETKAENVKFGEVVHAPPVLSAPRNAARSTVATRPGVKHLLLSSLIGNKQTTGMANKSELHKVANKVIDKTGKRKDLPNALRRKLEQQQADIIHAYRLLKKQKHTRP